jgi:hypothetical protein
MLGYRIDFAGGIMLMDRLFAEGFRLALDDCKCAHGTGAKAKTGTITELLFDYLRLSIDYLNCPFNARADTETTPVTSLFINVNDFSDRHGCLLDRHDSTSLG